MPSDEIKPTSPASPALSALDKILSMREDELMPWEEVVLPSEGLYYDGAVPDGRTQVRPMGLFADKILATQRLAQSGKSLDWLFKKCVKFPNDDKFDPLNLLAGDRIFLLYYLRGITHGNAYEFIVRCTNEDCSQAGTHEYDLNNLVRTIKRPNKALGSEPFKVVLPYLSKITNSEFWVKIRLLRGYDMQSMLTQRNVAKKIGQPNRQIDVVDETLEDNLNMLMIDVMGDTNRTKIKEFVNRMHASDTATIREFLNENSPGIDTTIVINCTGCGQEMRMELPITESFFRPTHG